MLKTLAKSDIPFHCTIAGDGKDRGLLENMVDKLGLRNKVSFTGFVSEPEKLWQDCDVFCFPIRWQEPFGLVSLEAMAHGIPVVAFDLGGAREYLTDTVNGFAVPEKGDMNAAFSRIYEHHRTLLPALSQAASKTAEENFSEENFINNFRKLTEGLK